VTYSYQVTIFVSGDTIFVTGDIIFISGDNIHIGWQYSYQKT
jgi:hypothetical protein